MKENLKISSLVCGSILLFSNFVSASHSSIRQEFLDCGQALRPATGSHTTVKDPQYREYFVDGVKFSEGRLGYAIPTLSFADSILFSRTNPMARTLTFRGFDNSLYPRTVQNAKIIDKSGGLWWGTRVILIKGDLKKGLDADFIKRVFEEAKPYNRSFQHLQAVGFFGLGDEYELGVLPTEKGTKIAPETVIKIFMRGLVEVTYFDENANVLTEPRVRILKGEDLLMRMNFDIDPQANPKFVLGNAQSFGRNLISVPGWFTGRYKGIIDHEDFMRSNFASEAIAFYKQLYPFGYKLAFNPTDSKIIEQAMYLIQNTVRVTMEGGSLVKLSTNKNRHTSDPSVLAHLRHLLKTGDGYLSVLLDPKGNVIGGEIGSKNGMTGETIFHDAQFAKAWSFGVLDAIEQANDSNGSGNRDAKVKLNAAARISMLPVVMVASSRGIGSSVSGLMATNYSVESGATVKPIHVADQIMDKNKNSDEPLPTNLVINPHALLEHFPKGSLPPSFYTVVAELKRSQNVELVQLARREKSGAIGSQRFVGSRPAPVPELVEQAQVNTRDIQTALKSLPKKVIEEGPSAREKTALKLKGLLVQARYKTVEAAALNGSSNELSLMVQVPEFVDYMKTHGLGPQEALKQLVEAIDNGKNAEKLWAKLVEAGRTDLESKEAKQVFLAAFKATGAVALKIRGRIMSASYAPVEQQILAGEAEALSWARSEPIFAEYMAQNGLDPQSGIRQMNADIETSNRKMAAQDLKNSVTPIKAGKLRVMIFRSFDEVRDWAAQNPVLSTETLFIVDEQVLNNDRFEENLDPRVALVEALDKERFAGKKIEDFTAFTFKDAQAVAGTKDITRGNVRRWDFGSVFTTLQPDEFLLSEPATSGRTRQYIKVTVPGWVMDN